MVLDILSAIAFPFYHVKRQNLKVIDCEKDWKSWCDTEKPEEEKLPCGYSDVLGMRQPYQFIYGLFKRLYLFYTIRLLIPL